MLNCCVIGAGPSGLCAAKESLKNGFNVTVYDKCDGLGGIWRYTDKTGQDEYGLNIHSAIYKGLRLNGPRELMEFPDFPYPNGTKTYPMYTEVLKYYESYADHFDLKRHIKFKHNVIHINPIKNKKWEIKVNNLVTNEFETRIFDAVFVASGRYAFPNIPEFEGATKFEGKIIHSHDFRDANKYRGDHILVVGGGPSATDIVALSSKTAERIIWSQHKIANESIETFERRKSLLQLPNVTIRNDIKHFTATGATFEDGSHETFSVAIFATGYKFEFPFLSAECGIHVEDNFIQPLYKHIINIKHPTMVFVGVPFLNYMEVKFAMKFISGAKKLPSKQEMLTDMQIECENHWNNGYPKHRTHYLTEVYRNYITQLSEAAEIENIPEVIFNILEDSLFTQANNPYGFREYNYVIIDKKTFKKEKCTTLI